MESQAPSISRRARNHASDVLELGWRPTCVGQMRPPAAASFKRFKIPSQATCTRRWKTLSADNFPTAGSPILTMQWLMCYHASVKPQIAPECGLDGSAFVNFPYVHGLLGRLAVGFRSGLFFLSRVCRAGIAFSGKVLPGAVVEEFGRSGSGSGLG